MDQMALLNLGKQIGEMLEAQERLSEDFSKLTTEFKAVNDRLHVVEKSLAFARGGWKGATIVAALCVSAGAGIYYLVEMAAHFFNLNIHQ